MSLTLGSLFIIVAAVIFGVLAFQNHSWLAGGLCLFAAGHVLDGVVASKRRAP